MDTKYPATSKIDVLREASYLVELLPTSLDSSGLKILGEAADIYSSSIVGQQKHGCLRHNTRKERALRSRQTVMNELPRSGPYRAKVFSESVNRRNREGSSKNMTNPDERKWLLESDHWTSHVEEGCLICKGCGKNQPLEKRKQGSRKFYPGEWIRHRSTCTGIKKKLNQHAKLIGLHRTSKHNDKYWGSSHKAHMREQWEKYGGVIAEDPNPLPEWLKFSRDAADETKTIIN